MKKVILRIGGMSCSACSNSLEKFLNKQDGIFSSTINLVMANAVIEYDDEKLKLKDIEKFIKQAGFESQGIYREDENNKNNKVKKRNFIIFTVLSIILMYISMGHMLGIPVVKILDPYISQINYVVTLAILSFIYLIYGWDIIKSGILKLIHKSPNMDTLVAIGVLSSYLYSVFGMIMIFNGKSEFIHSLYFESAAIVIFFIKLGRYIESISKDRTKEAIKKLVQITPKTAIIKIDGREKEVTIDEINIGDTVISHAGDKISVDGEVIFGKSHIDESFITGESKPVSKEIGDKVVAGSLNYDGYLEYRAEKIGKDSTISQIVKLVVEATASKAPIAKIADKISRNICTSTDINCNYNIYSLYNIRI
ncbi:MAG: heavy metal translocating P-type ATPase [Clostridia bacterium]|nr:heavy metal translocating P-type ATPase [Clostridia bacterium]